MQAHPDETTVDLAIGVTWHFLRALHGVLQNMSALVAHSNIKWHLILDDFNVAPHGW